MADELPELGSECPEILIEFLSIEYRSVDTELLKSVHASLEMAVEHVRSLLAEHDTNLGRSTRKNRVWAQQLESDIRMLESSYEKLHELLS